MKMQETHLDNAAQEFTFKPLIRPSSATRPQISGGFMERQEQFLRRALDKKREITHSEEEACTFQPQVNNTHRTRESMKEKVERWTSRDNKVQEELKEKYSAECNFKPQINPKSREMASKPKEEKQRQSVESELKMKEEKECPFKPTLEAKKYRNVESTYKGLLSMKPPKAVFVGDEAEQENEVENVPPSKFAEIQRARQEKMMRELKQKELEEMKNCTFQPAINNDMP